MARVTRDALAPFDLPARKYVAPTGVGILASLEFQPQGRAFPILKRHSHVTIKLDTRPEAAE